MKLALLTYDGPHFKTQEMVLHLVAAGYEIEWVAGAPWRQLSLPPATVRVDPRYTGLLHPRAYCERLSIPYVVFEHRSPELVAHAEAHPADLAVIGGARILRAPLIRSFRRGILNIHPGRLPEVRGLDTLKWSIIEGVEMALTAHLIDEHIDAGRLILRESVPVHLDDTLPDVALRMVQLQPPLLVRSLQVLEKTTNDELAPLPSDGAYYSSMPPEIEAEVPGKLSAWLRQHSVS